MSGVVQNMNKSSDVVYKLAETPAEFRGAHALMRAEGRTEKATFSWPTVIGKEDDEIVAVIGTTPNKNMIQAGPLVLKSDRDRRYTVLRLIEVYETLLQTLGISTYTIFVYDTDEKMMMLLLKLPATDVIAEEDDGVLFARRLKNGS